MKKLRTFADAVKHAHDWIDDSGIDPEDYELAEVVQAQYRWNPAKQSYQRVFPGRFVGVHYKPVVD